MMRIEMQIHPNQKVKTRRSRIIGNRKPADFELIMYKSDRSDTISGRGEEKKFC